jgi:hypothetical protein
MSLTQLKDQAAHLSFKQQRELMAFLISLQTDKDEGFKKTLAAKIDDQNPANWVDLDELSERYANWPPCPTACSWMWKSSKFWMRCRRNPGRGCWVISGKSVLSPVIFPITTNGTTSDAASKFPCFPAARFISGLITRINTSKFSR